MPVDYYADDQFGTEAPTLAEFVIMFPVLKSIPNTTIQMQLNLTTQLLDSSAWGKMYNAAVGYEAAHNLVLNEIAQANGSGAINAAAGQIVSASVAGMSTSFAQTQGEGSSDEWYSKTSFGQFFLRLRQATIPPVLMAI